MKSSTGKSKPSPPGPSPKLAAMLREATPDQIRQATKIAANLLAIKAKKSRG